MQIAIHQPRGDVDSQVAYCKRLGVGNVCLFAAAMPGFKEHGYPDPRRLREVIARFDEAGVKVPVMGIGRPTPAAILGKPEADPETEGLLKTIDSIGSAGVRAALIYHRAPIGYDGVSDETYWDRIVKHWRTIVDQAERSDVRIANHAFYVPRTMMVWNAETILKLIDAVPSPYNGVTYCTKFYMADDDVYSTVEKFKGRIFFSHARDLVRKADPDYWVKYEEVQLGDGDIDWARLFGILDGAGYEGTVAPEHLGEPRTPGEEPEAVAVQYLKKLL